MNTFIFIICFAVPVLTRLHGGHTGHVTHSVAPNLANGLLHHKSMAVSGSSVTAAAATIAIIIIDKVNSTSAEEELSPIERQVVSLAFPITVTVNKKHFIFQTREWKPANVFEKVCGALNVQHCEKLCIISEGSKIEFFNEKNSFASILFFSINNKNKIEFYKCD